MTYVVRLHRWGPRGTVVTSNSFGTLQEARGFIAREQGRVSTDFAVIVETDHAGKEILTQNIEASPPTEYVPVMVETMDEFIADLRRQIAGWRQDAAHFEAEGVTGILPIIKSWIEAGQQVVDLHKGKGPQG
jgi:hypothetical protein